MENPVGMIKQEKVKFLHDFLLKEFEWGGMPHIAHECAQFVSAFGVSNRSDKEIQDWLLKSPLAQFAFVLVIHSIADSPIYKSEKIFADLRQILFGSADGFMFGVTQSKKEEFKVSNNWVLEAAGSWAAIFKYKA